MDYFDNHNFPKAKRALLTVSSIILFLSLMTTEEYVLNTPVVKLSFNNQDKLIWLLLPVLGYQLVNFGYRFIHKKRQGSYEDLLQFEKDINSTGIQSSIFTKSDEANRNYFELLGSFRKLFKQNELDFPEDISSIREFRDKLNLLNEKEMNDFEKDCRDLILHKSNISFYKMLSLKRSLVNKSNIESNWLDFYVPQFYGFLVFLWVIVSLLIF